jgi:hypothetical protein
MLQFTTPQSGNPRENKSAIAYQVRQHAAKVAAARQRKIRKAYASEEDADDASLPVESCFMLNLDNDTEKSRQVSAEVVKMVGDLASGKRGRKGRRPKWTSVYRLDAAKKSTSEQSGKSSPAASQSTPSNESPSPEIESQSFDGASGTIEDDDVLWWPSLPDGSLNAVHDSGSLSALSITDSHQWSNNYPTLIASGRHVPDVIASLLASELGSGFRGMDCLSETLKEAQMRAVGATVAIDRELTNVAQIGPSRAIALIPAINANGNFQNTKERHGVRLCSSISLKKRDKLPSCTKWWRSNRPCPLPAKAYWQTVVAWQVSFTANSSSFRHFMTSNCCRD